MMVRVDEREKVDRCVGEGVRESRVPCPLTFACSAVPPDRGSSRAPSCPPP